MQDTKATSTDRRSQVHTEVRAPIEAVLSRVVIYVFSVIEVLIAIRFVLKLLGASTKAGFVTMMYAVSDVFMAPFSAIFKTQEASGSIFELSALAAIAIYALIAWGIVVLVRVVSPRSQSQTVERVETDEDIQTP